MKLALWFVGLAVAVGLGTLAAGGAFCGLNGGTILLGFLGALWFLLGLCNDNRTWMRNGVIVVGATLCGLCLAAGTRRLQRAVSQARGDTIAEALERHRTRHGTYPGALGMLVPEFLVDLPASAMGFLTTVPFEFGCNGPDFWLGFEVDGWRICERTRAGTWRVRD